MWIVWVWLAAHQSNRIEALGRYSETYAWFVGAAGLCALAATWLLRPARLGLLRWPAVAALAGSALLALLTAEAAVRALDLFGTSYYEETSRYLSDTEPDGLLGYRHRAGREETYQGVAVEINGSGLRERELDGGYGRRVLLLGDSVTFGWGVEAEETFGRRLEEIFPGLETVNAGVCGYNTVQQLRYLETEGLALEPDALFVLFTENDVQPAIEIARDSTAPAIREGASLPLAFLLRHSWLYRLGYHATANPPVTPPADLDRARQESFQALDRIARLSEREGVPLAVFFYRLYRTPVGDRIWQDIATLAIGRGFTAADTLPWFDGLNLDELTNSFVDPHPNPRAHRILAAGMADTLTTPETARNRH